MIYQKQYNSFSAAASVAPIVLWSAHSKGASNIHNHARYLRDRRPCSVPEVGMTEVYHGDLLPIASADLDHINEVSQKNIARIPMQPGDVLLCDNYRVLHGRDIFKGDRYHAVGWFGGLVKDRPAGYEDENANSKPGDVLNKL